MCQGIVCTSWVDSDAESQKRLEENLRYQDDLTLSDGGSRIEPRRPSQQQRHAARWSGGQSDNGRRIRKPNSSQSNEVSETSVPKFGPFYSGDGMLVCSDKEEAWQHVVKKSPLSGDETIKQYTSAMQGIEQQARDTYAEGSVDHISSAQFQNMMMVDGCTILQLVLRALGISASDLGYDSSHRIFGETHDAKHMFRRWLHALFFVGNQLPLVVLRELMKQEFFLNVLGKRTEWKRPSDMIRLTLFEQLVFPFLRPSCYEKMARFLRPCSSRFEPSDVLHALHLRAVGLGSSTPLQEEEDEEEEEEEEEICGATELSQNGICFLKGRGRGIGGISLTTTMFCAYLALPTLQVDEDTEALFQCLRNYETSQGLQGMGSYLQFMSELVRTPEDAGLLASKGIVKAARRKDKDKLPGVLSRLVGKETKTNQKLRRVRLRIQDYTRFHWEKIRSFLSLVLLLSLVQTIYAVLGYYKPDRH